MNRYRKFQTLVMGMSVLDVPIGIFTGYMMANWSWGDLLAPQNLAFLAGASVLVVSDLANSKAWLKEIEVAIRELVKPSLAESKVPS